MDLTDLSKSIFLDKAQVLFLKLLFYLKFNYLNWGGYVKKVFLVY